MIDSEVIFVFVCFLFCFVFTKTQTTSNEMVKDKLQI